MTTQEFMEILQAPQSKDNIIPSSREAEMTVLSCMLNASNSLSTAAESLEDTDFYYSEHKIIFHSLKNLYKNDKPADILIISEELKSQRKFDAAGGLNYLTTLAQFGGISAHIEEYINQVLDKSARRRAISVAQQIIVDSCDEKKQIQNTLEKSETRIAEIGKSVESIDKISIKEIIGSRDETGKSLLETLLERQAYYKENNEPFITGIPTGFIDLDKKGSLLDATNLIIIAGRTGMGKTSFALNLVGNVCFDQKLPVGIISLEMGAVQLAQKLVSLHSEITGDKLRNGTFTDLELVKISNAVETLENSPLFIIDSGCDHIAKLVSKSRKLKDERDIRLLVIDYVQLLNNGGNSSGRQFEVAEISRRLKLLANELKIPIICIAQLSRKVEERTNHRPMLSDLRDSGQLEQDADVIMFLYRRDYYDKLDKPGQAEIIIAKNRHGGEFDASLMFQKDFGRFANLAHVSSVVHDYSNVEF